MNEPVVFQTFDPTPYQRTPRLDIFGALALARALLELRLRDPPPQIDRFADTLERLVTKTEDAVTARRRDKAQSGPWSDASLAVGAKLLWSTLRRRLDAWQVFEHPGLLAIMEAHGKRSATAVALARARKKAEQARDLKKRLFGSDGLRFIQRSLPQQVRSMASLLKLIEDDGLAPAIDELAGPELMIALLACQARCEAMIQVRMSTRGNKAAHLGQLLAKLQHTIARYCNAVLTLVDDNDPATLDMVLTALQPMRAIREQRHNSGRPKPKAPAGAADDPATSVA